MWNNNEIIKEKIQGYFRKRALALFIFLFFILTAFSVSKPVYVKWHKLESEYIISLHEKTFVNLKKSAQLLDIQTIISGDDLIVIKKPKWKVVIFPKVGLGIINSSRSEIFGKENFIYRNGEFYIEVRTLAKIFNIELKETSKGYYFVIGYAKVQSVNAITIGNKGRVIIDLSQTAQVKIYPLVKTYGYIVEISPSVIPKRSIIKYVGGRYIDKIKAYHHEKQEVWVVVYLNSKPLKYEMKLENGSVILDFQFERILPIVVIDPGHGGIDAGCVGFLGTKEKDVTLKVAKEVKENLKKYPLKVYLTREKDEFINLYKRAKFSNDLKADLFISIHLNSFLENRKVRGSEIYYFAFSEDKYARKIAWKENLDPQKDSNVIDFRVMEKRNTIDESVKFAKILKNHVEIYKIPFRHISAAEFAVLAYTRSPAVLFELEFLSNPSVEIGFRSGTMIKIFADIITDSILEFFGLK